MDIESRLTALENAVEAIHQRHTELEKKAAAATTAEVTIDGKKIGDIFLNNLVSGKKSINEIRKTVGLDQIDGGDKKFVRTM
jgi:hypothetical protein